MKKFLQGALLPFGIFITGMTLLGCDQVAQSENQESETHQINTAPDTTNTTAQTELKSGNMFYVIRDVADLQLKAGDYIGQLQQTKTDLQSAVNAQDHEALQHKATQLRKQLTDFNQALTSINLKTQEISDIRQNLLTANEQVLATPFLNGQVDLSKVDLKKIEQQMGSIQSEMLKLASMLLQNNSDHSNSSENSES